MNIDGYTSRLEARSRAEDDPYWVTKFVLGFDQLIDEYHGALCEWFKQFTFSTEHDIAVCMEARQHYKSTCLTVGGTIWEWILDADLRFLIGHAKKPKALDFLGLIKRLLEPGSRAYEKLLWIAPDVFYRDPVNQSPAWLRDKLTIKRNDESNTFSLEVASPEAGVASKHFHRGKFDDIVDEDNYKTAYQRNNVWTWFKNCNSLFLPGSKVMDIGTSWHHDDTHARILNPANGYMDQAMVRRTGAYGEPGATSGDPIFPRTHRIDNHKPFGWDAKSLELRRKRDGDRIFFCQMLNDPTPRSESIFKRENFEWYDGSPKPESLALNTYIAVDSNRGTGAEAGDYGVVMVGQRDENGHIWVRDIYRGHPTQQQMIEVIFQMVARWEPINTFFEVTAGQLRDAQAIRAEMLKTGITFRFTEINRSRANKKGDRHESLEALVENRGLHLKMGVCDELALELEHYGAWRHDDQLDCLADIWIESTRAKPKREVKRVPNNPNTFAAVHAEATKRLRQAQKPKGVSRRWAYASRR